MPARPLPNLLLQAFFDLGEDGWNDEFDNNMLKLSVLVQSGVSAKVAAEPVEPAAGLVILLDETHATHPNAIAVFDAGAWVYVTPNKGWLTYDQLEEVYLTFDGAVWAVLETGGGGVDDAPLDDKLYARLNGTWSEIPEDQVGITEAPLTDGPYARQAGGWVPVEVGGGNEGVEEAPADGKQYARQNGNWEEVIAPEPSGTGGKGPHRYWRMLITVGWNDANQSRTGFAELILTDEFDGISKTVGGTPTGSSGNFAAAFDGNTSSTWDSGSNQSPKPYFVAYEFPAPIQIIEARIVVNGAANGGLRFCSPRTGVFQYSDNGVDWFEAFQFNNIFQQDILTAQLTATIRDATYIPPYNDKVPQGGAAGDYLRKKSATDGDTEFGPLPFVSITQAAYDALATKDANIYYMIVG